VTDVPLPKPEKPRTGTTTPPPNHAPKGFTSNVIVSSVDSTNLNIDTAGRSHGSSSGKGPVDSVAIGSGGGFNKPDSAAFDENKVETIVEKMPEFPGGMDALMSYLSRHIDCGSLWRESGSDGNVVLSLVVSRDGSVSDVKVLRDGVGFGCADQAMSVIRNMPKWKPGMQGKRPVNVLFVLPVTYQKR